MRRLLKLAMSIPPPWTSATRVPLKAPTSLPWRDELSLVSLKNVIAKIQRNVKKK